MVLHLICCVSERLNDLAPATVGRPRLCLVMAVLMESYIPSNLQQRHSYSFYTLVNNSIVHNEHIQQTDNNRLLPRFPFCVARVF